MNQIEPSDLRTMSFGELSGFAIELSASTVILPLYSVQRDARVRCSQVSRRPWRSRYMPFGKFDGLPPHGEAAGDLVVTRMPVVRGCR